MANITVTKTTHSKVSEVDFEKIPFGKTFSDHMFVADFDGKEWTDMRVVPIAPFPMHPGNLTLHYGQAIFEGMKAFKNVDGEPVLFRPELHSQRINASAARMCMPSFPKDAFIKALEVLVDIEKDWIPTFEGSSLYLRPFMFATDEMLGVQASKTYKFVIITLPVGPYYAKPVSLKAETQYVRAIEGGVGEAKAAGNYAASLYPAKLAKDEGFDQIMWLDGKEFKYIQEVGTMNIFFVIGDTVVTPETDGAILKGITRMTIIEILKENGYKVEERKLAIDEVVAAHKSGQLKEVFGTGTAAVVSIVKSIHYKGLDMSLDTDSYQVAPFAKKHITQLRRGMIEDTKGWVRKIPSPVEAS